MLLFLQFRFRLWFSQSVIINCPKDKAIIVQHFQEFQNSASLMPSTYRIGMPSKFKQSWPLLLCSVFNIYVYSKYSSLCATMWWMQRAGYKSFRKFDRCCIFVFETLFEFKYPRKKNWEISFVVTSFHLDFSMVSSMKGKKENPWVLLLRQPKKRSFQT